MHVLYQSGLVLRPCTVVATETTRPHAWFVTSLQVVRLIVLLFCAVVLLANKSAKSRGLALVCKAQLQAFHLKSDSSAISTFAQLHYSVKKYVVNVYRILQYNLVLSILRNYPNITTY